VKLTSSASCASPLSVTGDMTMTVNSTEIPAVSLASDHYSDICQGTNVTFTAVPTFGGGSPRYKWMKNGIEDTANVTATYSYAPSNGDNLYCVLRSSYYCRVYDTGVSNSIMMTTVTPQTPAVVITATNGGYIGNGQPETFTANVTNAITSPSYQWSVNGGTVPGATLPVFTSSSLSDMDVVSCAVTSGGTCAGVTGSGSLTVHVGVSVRQIASSLGNVIISPNPNKGSFSISGSLAATDNGPVTIELTDLLGHVVYQGSGVVRNSKINEQVQLSGTLANGMYLLSLHAENDNMVFHVVVEQ
jgi:Secretion system C-terminal sorting domain